MLKNIKSNPKICNLKYLTAHGGEPWPEKRVLILYMKEDLCKYHCLKEKSETIVIKVMYNSVLGMKLELGHLDKNSPSFAPLKVWLFQDHLNFTWFTC